MINEWDNTKKGVGGADIYKLQFQYLHTEPILFIHTGTIFYTPYLLVKHYNQHKIWPFLVVLILSGNYWITRPGFNVLDDKNQ